jgi:hypothetical protein
MDRRPAIVALLALLIAAALPARAQFQPVVMKVKGVQQQAELASTTWPGASDHDLLVLLAGGTPANRRLAHHDLISVLPAPYAAPSAPTAFASAVGWLDGSVATSIADVAWVPGASYDLDVTWGENPAAWTQFAALFARQSQGLASIRLLPREQSVLLVTGGTRSIGVPSATPGELVAVDLSKGAAVTPLKRTWTVPAYGRAVNGDVSHDRIFPLRLSPGALQGGVEDVIVPFARGFFLLWHDSAPAAGASLASLAITSIDFGVASGDLTPYLPGTLATTLPWGSCLGAAGMDVDGDGVPDLVFSFGEDLKPSLGALLWIRNGGDPLAMRAQQPWGMLSGRSDLAAVTSVGTLRQLELDGGETALVVNDRLREKLVVVRGNGGSGFTTTELPLAGAELVDAIAVDVVGSPAKDLVALVDVTLYASEVWIYPDVGDLAPQLAWNPEPPSALPIGHDLTLSVLASDPDAPPLALRWIRPPAADVVDVSSVTLGGATLCDPATPIDVTVRAMDALGVYVTVQKTIALEVRPSLSIVGAAPPGRIVLVPGGTAARAEGEAWPACAAGAPTYTWGEVGLAGLVETARQPAGSAAAWREFTLPEGAYPEALAGTPALTLGASGAVTTGGTVSGTATLPLELDGAGLVSAEVGFDEAALAPGELGHVRVRLQSRIGVALPAVLARVRLAGLVFAGPLIVEGAEAAAGSGAGEVVIASLPAAGTEVEIVAPVRSVGGPGGASVELFSSGGVRLSPAAAPASGSTALPGCGCASGSGGEGLPIALALSLLGYMKPIRRVLARTR